MSSQPLDPRVWLQDAISNNLISSIILGLVVVGLTTLYSLLILLTPTPTQQHASEKLYETISSDKPISLPSTVSDKPTIDLTVIVPAFNETERMPSMLTAALSHLSTLQSSGARTSEVLLIDDGSADGTADAALSMSRAHAAANQRSGRVEIRVVRLVRNLGKGGAVRHGMLHARGRRLLMVDADGASRFEDLEKLWEAMDMLAPGEDDEGVVVGSRAHMVNTAAVVKRSFLRNILMHGLHTILRVVGVDHIQDTQCGFKLFSRAAARQIFPRQHITNWIFDVELLLLARQLGIPAVEVPINWHEVAGSKLNVVWDSLQMLRDLLVMRGNHITGRWRVRRDDPVPKAKKA